MRRVCTSVILQLYRRYFANRRAFKGDAWLDAKGMFHAAAGAGPVYKLLGKKDLGTTDLPPIETAEGAGSYSDSVMNEPTNELRLSGLLHVVPKPWPAKVLAIA